MRRAAAALLVLALAACGEDPSSTPPPTNPPPPDGGVPGCPAGERLLEDGSCQKAGVRPEACAEGFQPDDDGGCTPILPAEPCAYGSMALPGETECREVASCGDPPWGDIPVEATTQYVDGSYAGTDSDGSARRPWTNIMDAVYAAASGDVVAIAEGSYPESVLVAKPVRLWGRCPALVEIVGTETGLAAVDIRGGADGAEVHTLAVTGPMTGIAASGASDVLIDRVWAHDNGRAALSTEHTLGPGNVRIEGSLLERAIDYGIFDDSMDLEIYRTVIRDVDAGADGPGRGINLQTTMYRHVARATISGLLLERATELAIFVFASELALEGSVIRDTRATARGDGGRALNIEDDPDTGERSNVVVRSSVLEHNRDIEVTCTGCDLLMESTTLRDTQPLAIDQSFGRCFSTQDSAGRSSVVLRESVFVRCNDVGVLVVGSDATLESVLIRDIAAEQSNLGHGRALSVQYGLTTAQRGNVIARWSVMERAHEFGVAAIGSDVRLENSLVREVAGTELDGQFGDGLTLFTTDQPTNAWIVGSRIEHVARAGVSSFGGAVEIAGTVLECNPIHLNGESLEGKDASFADIGGVVCGCEGITDTCSVSTAQLTPPEPLDE